MLMWMMKKREAVASAAVAKICFFFSFTRSIIHYECVISVEAAQCEENKEIKMRTHTWRQETRNEIHTEL